MNPAECDQVVVGDVLHHFFFFLRIARIYRTYLTHASGIFEKLADLVHRSALVRQYG